MCKTSEIFKEIKLKIGHIKCIEAMDEILVEVIDNYVDSKYHEEILNNIKCKLNE